MVICPECGEDVTEANFCKNCGAKLPEIKEEVPDKETKFCQNCGTEVDADANECPSCGFQFVVEQTKFCESCGEKVKKDIEFCPNCGFHFTADQTKFCASCGEKININADVCPKCGVRTGNFSSSGEKSIALAALLSFIFPGIGHLYIGLDTKGISFIVAYIVSCALMLLLVGFVLVVIVWLWAMIDVIKSTEAINNGEYVEDKLF